MCKRLRENLAFCAVCAVAFLSGVFYSTKKRKLPHFCLHGTAALLAGLIRSNEVGRHCGRKLQDIWLLARPKSTCLSRKALHSPSYQRFVLIAPLVAKDG